MRRHEKPNRAEHVQRVSVQTYLERELTQDGGVARRTVMHDIMRERKALGLSTPKSGKFRA